MTCGMNLTSGWVGLIAFSMVITIVNSDVMTHYDALGELLENKYYPEARILIGKILQEMDDDEASKDGIGVAMIETENEQMTKWAVLESFKPEITDIQTMNVDVIEADNYDQIEIVDVVSNGDPQDDGETEDTKDHSEKIIKQAYGKVEKESKEKNFVDDAKKMAEKFVMVSWPKFAAQFSDMDLKKMMDAYDKVSFADSVPIRFIRDYIAKESGVGPENWRYLEIALILFIGALIMSFHIMTVIMVAVAAYLFGDALWIVATVSLVLKAVYRMFSAKEEVNEYYVEYNKKHDGTNVSLVGLSLLCATILVGLICSNVVPVHVVWIVVLTAMMIIMLYMFPAVVQKSSIDGLGLVLAVCLMAAVVMAVTSEFSIGKMLSNAHLKWKFPYGDLEKYIPGLERVDNAGMAREIAIRAGRMEPEFLIDTRPMGWEEALKNRITDTYARHDSYDIGAIDSEMMTYWIVSRRQTTNMTMLLISVVSTMSIMLLGQMGSQLVIEGERREQNMAARARDGGMRIDQTVSFATRIGMALTGTFTAFMMVIEYLFAQWVCDKLYLSLSLVLIVPIGILIATFVIEKATGTAWMDMGGAPHRGIRNVNGGVAFMAPPGLRPFEKSMEGYVRLVLMATTVVSAFFAWETGGWPSMLMGICFGGLAVAFVDVGALRSRKQILVLVFMCLTLQFYGTAVMLLLLRWKGRVITFFRHNLHNAGNPLQMGE